MLYLGATFSDVVVKHPELALHGGYALPVFSTMCFPRAWRAAIRKETKE